MLTTYNSQPTFGKYNVAKEIEIPISASVLAQIQKYAAVADDLYRSEIAGWAHYTKEKGIYKLAPLCRQEASGAEVNNFPNDILNNIDYDMSDMNVQWHSHVKMKAFWSPTDENCISDTLKLTKYLISIVVNVFGEIKCRIDYLSENKTVFGLNPIQITYDGKLIIRNDDNSTLKEVKRKLYEPPQPIVMTTGLQKISKDYHSNVKMNKPAYVYGKEPDDLFSNNGNLIIPSKTNAHTNEQKESIRNVIQNTLDKNKDKMLILSNQNEFGSVFFGTEGFDDLCEWNPKDCKLRISDVEVTLTEFCDKYGWTL